MRLSLRDALAWTSTPLAKRLDTALNDSHDLLVYCVDESATRAGRVTPRRRLRICGCGGRPVPSDRDAATGRLDRVAVRRAGHCLRTPPHAAGRPSRADIAPARWDASPGARSGNRARPLAVSTPPARGYLTAIESGSKGTRPTSASWSTSIESVRRSTPVTTGGAMARPPAGSAW